MKAIESGWLGKRPVRVMILISVLAVALVAVNSISNTNISPPAVGPTLPSPEPVPEPTEQPPTQPPEQITELVLEGVIIRSSGDSNPFIGTPWISVSCHGYMGTPIVAVDVDINQVYKTLIEAGVDYGQNIIYTGQEDYPKGSQVKIFFQWNDGDKTIKYDVCEIIFDKNTGKSLDGLGEPFVFLGSYICCGQLEGADTGCIGCTVNCPKALFVPYKDNSGYLLERARHYIPDGILPEPGTKVTVIITWPGSSQTTASRGLQSSNPQLAVFAVGLLQAVAYCCFLCDPYLTTRITSAKKDAITTRIIKLPIPLFIKMVIVRNSPSVRGF